MKSVGNTPNPIIQTIGLNVCNHRACCKGNDRCMICGRRICEGCTSSHYMRTHGIAICLICSKQYKPDEIKLHDD